VFGILNVALRFACLRTTGDDDDDGDLICFVVFPSSYQVDADAKVGESEGRHLRTGR